MVIATYKDKYFSADKETFPLSQRGSNSMKMSVENDEGDGRMAEFEMHRVFGRAVQSRFPPVVEHHAVGRPYESF